MDHQQFSFPEQYYKNHLATIDGIHFTQREVDIIACLISAQRTSAIASILYISPNTVNTHLRNITPKIDRNTQAGIIDFFQKSPQLQALRTYYDILVTQSAFEKSLASIRQKIRETASNTFVLYWQDENLREILLKNIKKDLEKVGIHMSISETPPNTPIENHAGLTLYLCRKDELPPGSAYQTIDGTSAENYYFLVFDIIHKIYPNIKMDEFQASLKEMISQVHSSLQKGTTRITKGISHDGFLQKFSPYKNKHFLFGGGFLSVFIIFAYLFLNMGNHSPEIRADLITPLDKLLLRREGLLHKIDTAFSNQKGIRSVALVGLGGAGKTILARQYMKEQKTPIAWELNAESVEYLTHSLEGLAYEIALHTNTEDKLGSIMKIPGAHLRLQKVTSFIKNYLHKTNDWILLYDNVTELGILKDYFPHDSNTWGNGKVIITTRNANIQHNMYFDSQNVINVGYLSEDEQEELFTNILPQKVNPAAAKGTRWFLKFIPPFPLDVCACAYDLKTTGDSMESYIENTNLEETFSKVADNTKLRDIGDYAESRKDIIVRPFKKIIKAHPNFETLFTLISIIDSQYIPVDLLYKVSDKDTVDDFLKELNRHSFMTQTSDSRGKHFISFHRVTQEIASEFFLDYVGNKKEHYIQNIADIIAECLDESVNKKEIDEFKALENHVLKVIERESNLTSSQTAKLLCHAGNFYKVLGNNDKADLMIHKAYKLFSETGDLSGTSLALEYLGSLESYKGNFSTAENYLKQSINDANVADKVSLGRKHTFLGVVYLNQGRYQECKATFEKALSLFQTENKNFNMAWIYGSLGRYHIQVGEYEKAYDLFTKSHDMFASLNNTFGKAWCKGYMGYILNQQGEYDRALETLEKTIKIYTETFGEDHIKLAWLYNYYGATLINIKREKEAIDFLNRSKVLYTENYSDIFHEMGNVEYNLGRAYYSLGHMAEAKDHMQESLKILRRTNHPDAFWPLCGLALLDDNDSNTENFLEAQTLFETFYSHSAAHQEALKKASF